MNNMFRVNLYFNRDISNWDVGNVTDMGSLFRESVFSQNIGSWDVSNVIEMSWMFQESYFNQNIGNWDVSSVQHMSRMFLNAFIFNQDISGWCVEQIPDEPDYFSYNCPLTPVYQPHWGEECFVGINHTEVSDLHTYPNPAASTITIDIEPEKSKEINIYNQYNQRVLNTSTSTREIDISALSSGIYIVEILTNEKRFIQKIIKK